MAATEANPLSRSSLRGWPSVMDSLWVWVGCLLGTHGVSPFEFCAVQMPVRDVPSHRHLSLSPGANYGSWRTKRLLLGVREPQDLEVLVCALLGSGTRPSSAWHLSLLVLTVTGCSTRCLSGAPSWSLRGLALKVHAPSRAHMPSHCLSPRSFSGSNSLIPGPSASSL